jgi:Ca2+-binding RTX toxin-like protein
MARKSTLQFYSASNKFNELGAMFYDALIDGTIGPPKKHKFALTGIDGGKFVIKGDFEISGGVITGGKIKGFTAFVDGNKVMQATNLRVKYSDFKEKLDNARLENDPDTESLFLLILTADQTLGSQGDDLMFGLSGFIKGGGGNDTIVSGFGDKFVWGEGGNDLIIAGVGDDRLFGGKGRDIFAFTMLEDGVDRLKDFNAKRDKIGFDDGSEPDDDFFVLGPTVDLTEFVVGEAALTAEHHLIHDRASGRLYWDGDGVGGTGQVLLAVLPEKLKLTSANFVVDDYT